MLPPNTLREARSAADDLHKTATASWMHLLAPAQGGPMNIHNLVAGTQAANADFLALEQHLRTFLGNIARWSVQQNYNPQFLADVTFWSNNLSREIGSAVDNSRQQGVPAAGDLVESIRITINYVSDPYNFGDYPELPPHR
jgi:hypothetical protein